MGQKVNPTGLRIGINQSWNSIWYSDRNYSTFLHEDLKIRDFLKKKLYSAGVSKINISRKAEKLIIDIYTARPGMIYGKKGSSEFENLKTELARLIKIKNKDININIIEVKKPEIDATLVAEGIASQLEKRIAFKRAMKKSVSMALKSGAKGIKITCGGRLAGAEIARAEWYREGRVPLHTLRADINYGTAEANTTYGKIGIKVWIYKGDVL
ncbi:MAG: 30S ribosomal protein S3 [Candidatus Acidulodesulfobacterium ferriphilum]|uniref:Small ribosomal subunit protein uS3 n=1 Tax=Candidatus Acidulodesulfobacterium ferriphilum TaxID=2597223 RepID=A0A519BD14_9DELT|nr:30S ribosomal protein S3 [Deltaproteobacteria bacterium]MCL5892211.1 30S ribosomal protein S3 [Deltaproteobacteria bacterium]RZD15163.1 MAG: 30S ribosomal protein S3 [Candidatus Acidulodesulfobacterium ferriphilum]